MGGLCKGQTNQQAREERERRNQQTAALIQNIQPQPTVVPKVQNVAVIQPNKSVEVMNKENPDGKNSNGEEDDFYLQDIMKQFDELNNLFQQMSEEFENMSKYLASINDGD